MKNPVTKISYILTTFPCRSETFAAREMEALGVLGCDITILAAEGQQRPHDLNIVTEILYRPPVFSSQAFLSVGYLLTRYPLAIVELLYLAIRLILRCPHEAVSLVSNIHTIGFFAKNLDRKAISHIHAYFLNWPAIIGLALSIVTGRSYSISAHARDIFVEHGAIKLKAFHAKFVTACTRQGLEYLRALLPLKYHKKLCLNYHGIKIASDDPDQKKSILSEMKLNNTAIAVGRLVPKKGFDNLLRAFALVIKKKSNCKLMIVGDGPEKKQLIVLMRSLSLEYHVELLGWQEHNVTLQLIKKATILVVPSLVTEDGDRDGIPNVILEAFAGGTPVVASNLEGICEAIENHRTGLLVEPGDIIGLALAITELLSSKYLLNQFSKMAYETVNQRFNLIKNIIPLVKLFESS